MEFLNPGASVKDRAAKALVMQAKAAGHRKIYEGTGGNTGVSLALMANALGMECVIALPESISPAKIAMMRTCGAVVFQQPVVPFSDPRHYYHHARKLAEENGGFFANQFENEVNWQAHYATTGPELLAQTPKGLLDGFVCAAGTGGTIAGVSRYLKEHSPGTQTYLVDPQGSILFSFVEKGECTPTPGSTITEGIGIGRVTKNFSCAEIDGAFQCTDQEAVDMAKFLLEREGLFLGPSSALNVCGAVKLARILGPGHTVITILCDSGERYTTTLWNPAFLDERDLRPKDTVSSDDLLSFVK
eukprot:CAMPEP_0119134702 /NCGR_PEP_ID=MMETSP1310-20130426/17618_1 /TAXON_ID=464262 /ORGANISM="Genus nov. species nov., Strain RCC2339" /LENGTH=301 /DNA_ID=CAMNT_0007125527 /DNA_START=333 /DNA_END=1238 /DNA_ORIENTATION=-